MPHMGISTHPFVLQVRKFVDSYGGALVEEFVPGREFTVLVRVGQPKLCAQGYQRKLVRQRELFLARLWLCPAPATDR